MITLVIAMVAITQVSGSKPAPEQPEYYDNPTFVVSGVTDYTYRGGHGSDVVLRSTEALTAAAASLKQEPGGAAPSGVDVIPAQREHANAEADEKRGDSLDAVREYQRTAELDPSEANLFDWGLELLTHRAADPAIEVFTKGNRLFPNSVRMLLGLAVSQYMRGEYDRAAKLFFQASDLQPADPTPYLFLARVKSNSIVTSKEYVQKLARFAELDPNNAWANYYYAACLWKQRTDPQDSGVIGQVRQLLQKSIRLDPQLGPAYLLLGIVAFDEKDLPGAISAYRKAIEVSPDLEEAHYRLSQTYAISGEAGQARQELQLYEQLSKNSAERAERERKEVQQFVFTLDANH